jgi:acyl-coenzyme A thioesterase PaaI-like protein
MMKIKSLLAGLALLLGSLACNWPDLLPPPAPEIQPTVLPTFIVPSDTPIPSATPLPTVTPTPGVPIAWPKDLGVNCRSGPGIEWAVVSALPMDTKAEILGRTSETTWWYIQDPLNPGSFCWVATSVTDTAGNMNIIPILEAPQALVTGVTVDAAVTFTACGGPNPITFSGSITTNGPATVTYHWEVGGDKQNATPDETIEFPEAGTQEIAAGAYSADCGKYFIRLLVTDPNEESARKDFKVEAP